MNLSNLTTEQLIPSGILEAYILGLVTEEEQYEIQQKIATNPQVFVHLNRLEDNLETHFRQVAVPPPPGIRDLIEMRAGNQSLKKHEIFDDFDFNQSATDGTAKQNYVEVEVDNTHIRVHKYWRLAFIAVFVLSKIFLAALLYFYFKADSQTQEIDRLKAEINHTVRK